MILCIQLLCDIEYTIVVVQILLYDIVDRTIVVYPISYNNNYVYSYCCMILCIKLLWYDIVYTTIVKGYCVYIYYCTILCIQL